MQNFTAETQYNVFIGTSAVDISDTLNFVDYLKEHSLIESNEFLVGYEIVFNENSGRSIPQPGIIAWVTTASNYEDALNKGKSEGYTLRPIDVQNLDIADFFKYFKRFNVMFSKKGIGLHGNDFTTY